MIPPTARTRLAAGPPYNPAGTVTIPTPDGTGHTIHPSVVDMGHRWNGYRFWLADTPYHSQSVALENPCILASRDGVTWEVPPGLTNPIDPWPGGAGYNSDVELVYDPDQDRLICYWRDYAGGSGVPGNVIFCAATSRDGVTWSGQIDLIEWTYPDTGAIYSPTVARVGPSAWRMWVMNWNNVWHTYTASDPLGPWSGPTNCTFAGTSNGGVSGLWHGAAKPDRDGIFRVICNAPRGVTSTLWLASSRNGIAWSGWANSGITSRTGQWDQEIYRSTLVPYDDFMRVWYSAYGADGQPRVGHTTLPLSLWPAPPA